MRSWILVPLVLLAHSAGAYTLWLDAEDFGAGLTPPMEAESGEAQVWVWAQGGRNVRLRLDEQELKLPREGSRESGHVWRHAGVVSAAPGKTMSLDASEGIAAVSLSSEPGFDPVKATRYTRVLDQPGALGDRRHEYVRNTDTIYTLPPYTSKEAWEATRETIRRRTLLGCGLYPLPEKTPLNSNISGRIEREGYSIEKVYFEALPGFLVTGNLYRPFPLPTDKKIPAILCPHGHWEEGRLQNDESCSVAARSITLAKMGASVFTYDMVGYNDSLQFKAHRWLDRATKLWGLTPFALQLWSSIRAVDFLETLPEVDADRIGCTGASGGGTQTFALYTVDDRIKVAAPVNMISCSMQGGCVCENGPLMRLEHSNLEIGAMMAPRPLLLVSATGDWTRETPRIEYPSIRSIYQLYGAEDKLEQVQIDAGHNYNQQSREAVYRFFAKHLLGLEGYENFTEPPYTMEPVESLRVFPDGQLPEGFLRDDALMERLKGYLSSQRAKRLSTLSPDERTALLRELSGAGDVEHAAPRFTRLSSEDDGERRIERWLVGSEARDERVPLIFIRARSVEPQPLTVFVNSSAASPWVNADGTLGTAVQQALEAGQAVALVDLYGAGPDAAPEAARWLAEAGEQFSDTFLPTQLGEHVRDMAFAHAWAMTRRDVSSLAAVYAALPYEAALMRVIGVPEKMIHVPDGVLGSEALEGPLYLPGFLALFEPSVLGL